MDRKAGILMPIFSLPSKYGIGSFSKEAYKFINGETFNVTPQMLGYEEDDYNKVKNGWYLITIDGISIGWGKLTNIIMKNHYPKGLRKSL